MFNITKRVPVENGSLRLRYIFICVVFALIYQRMAYLQVATYSMK